MYIGCLIAETKYPEDRNIKTEFIFPHSLGIQSIMVGRPWEDLEAAGCLHVQSGPETNQGWYSACLLLSLSQDPIPDNGGTHS